MNHDEIVGLLRRDVTPELYRQIRDEWKRHSLAEDRRDIAGLLSTLTPDCVYEIVGTAHVWRGHEGAAQFYTQLLGAFPDIRFELTGIVIGPQGVSEEASVRATHHGPWLGQPPTGKAVSFTVVIFFPWDLERGKFRGERIYHTFAASS
jgi:predicted ester cyclase